MSTPLYPEWPLAMIPGTSHKMTKELVRHLFDIQEDSPFAMQAGIGGWEIPANYKPVHDALKELNIGPYKEFNSFSIQDVIKKYFEYFLLVITFLILLIFRYIHILKIKRITQHSNQEVNKLNTTLEHKNIKLQDLAKKLSIAKDKAEGADVAKSQFLANMSHEIRTPINAVIGMQYLLEKTNLNSKQNNYVQKSKSAITSLLTLINDILDFSKIEAGKLDLESIVFDLNKVFYDLNNVIGDKAKEKGLAFHISIEPSTPLLVKGDPHRLLQVLLNLGSNALKFTENGRIDLRVKALELDNKHVTFEFSLQDSGIGISESQQENLFQVFLQADSSTTRRYGGSGLGLVISQKLAHLLGGKLWLESSTPGLGSNFCFISKMEIANTQETLSYTQEEDFTHVLSSINVLIVDDTQSARDILLHIVETLGIKGDTATSADEALLALEEKEYDLIFMDWQMPDMDGIQTCQKIRERTSIEKLPKIVFVTACRRSDIIEHTKEDEVDGILIKPVSSSMVLDVIMNSVGKERVLQIATQTKNVSLAAIRGSKVLLVEDNEINREFEQEMLHAEGIIVECATDGFEAIEKAKTAHYDLILMDIQMPNLDGLEATKRIRQLANILDDTYYLNIPIVALSANAQQRDIDMSLDAGMNDYVTKPVNPSDLFNTMLEWIKNKEVPQNKEDYKQNTPSTTYDFSILKGIDIEDVLSRTLHNEKLFVKILQEFYENYQNSLNTLVSLIDEGNFKDAQAHSHKMKGLLGNLGARDLFEELHDINSYLVHSVLPSSLQLQHVQTSFHLLMDSIAIFLAQSTHKNSNSNTKEKLSKHKAVTLMRSIIELLESDIGSAIEEFERFQSSSSHLISKDALREISQALKVFDTDKVKVLAQDLIKLLLVKR